MKNILNKIWIAAVIAVSLSLLWFLFGSTAFFNRWIDVVETFIYIFVWTPALLFVIISIVLLKKGWIPRNIIIQICMAIAIIILSVIFTKTLFSSADGKGWLTEYVRSDYNKLHQMKNMSISLN